MEIIRSSVTRTFPFVGMKQEEFLDFKALSKHITKCTSVGFSKACHLVVDIRHPNSYIIKMDYNFEDDPAAMSIVRLMKGKARYTQGAFNLSAVVLPTERLLTEEKCKDLKSLLNFLESNAQTCLEHLLKHQEQLRKAGGASEAGDSGPEDDPENDTQDYVPPAHLAGATRH